MRWNWQQEDWPSFAYEASSLRPAEDAFLKGGGVIVGIFHHVEADAQQALAIELISQEVVDSSAIEGEVLDRSSVQSSLARQLGFPTNRRKANAAEAGAAELMADLYRRYDAPLSEDLLFAWHRMLMNGRRDIIDVGRYRTHADPMQIVSGPLQAPRVHFEAPPSDHVAGEMARFMEWFNETRPDGAKPLPAITRAGIAHLWFETIHPFEDGNGRIGRAIAEKALAQSLRTPTLTALAETIHRHRKDYYAALHSASRNNLIDDWLRWFANIVTAAQARTVARVRFLIEKTRMLDRLGDRLNSRQEKLLLRMFAEGVDGFAGGLSAQNYRTITDAAPATATRDLAGLVEMGALIRSGELRYARYRLALSEPTVT